MQQIENQLYNEWVPITLLEGAEIDLLAYAERSSGAMPSSELKMSLWVVCEFRKP